MLNKEKDNDYERNVYTVLFINNEVLPLKADCTADV